MYIERILRGVAGFFVLLSLALGYFMDVRWYLFTAFVGLNLLQSAFTDWCPMMAVLRRVRVGGREPFLRGQRKNGLDK